ncbi:hypothetical protein K469DRAFT_122979 [Zopfia rhizophila CBS 207.26]|uniref:Uncharacterized protein n=1 Tax=Zopfia rhizophila CBS 207.26 TaxID=1314779 RepID=A0A6A6E7C6_9PEZI|nr:hypothetical protein K469DRAFT_122979 [Zopfia rhizophila CBS 207.26]
MEKVKLEIQMAKEAYERCKMELDKTKAEHKEILAKHDAMTAELSMKHAIAFKELHDKLETKSSRGKITNIFSPAPRSDPNHEIPPVLLFPSRTNPSYSTNLVATNVSRVSINTVFYKSKDRSIFLELDEEQKTWDLSNHILGTLAWEPSVISSSSELYLSLKHNGWSPTYIRATDGETVYIGDTPIHINFTNPDYTPQLSLPTSDWDEAPDIPSGYIAIGSEWVEREALSILGFSAHPNQD